MIGRSFSTLALASLVGSAAEVRTLVERGFIRPTEPELVFKHALSREVAYGSLPKAERARLHATYAVWLEEQDAGDGRAATLAYHYAEAANPEVAELAWRTGTTKPPACKPRRSTGSDVRPTWRSGDSTSGMRSRSSTGRQNWRRGTAGSGTRSAR